MSKKASALGDDARFDVYMLKRERLLVARPQGILGPKTAARIMDLVELKEEELETGFDRFCDLSRLEGVQLSVEDVLYIAQRRGAFNPNEIRVKSAFLAINPLVFAIARMYQQLLDSPRLKVSVWNNYQSAANWLEVECDKLTL